MTHDPNILAAGMFAYAMVTAFIVIIACICKGENDLDGNPLAYVFWPLIAINAAFVTIWNMWR